MASAAADRSAALAAARSDFETARQAAEVARREQLADAGKVYRDSVGEADHQWKQADDSTERTHRESLTTAGEERRSGLAVLDAAFEQLSADSWADWLLTAGFDEEGPFHGLALELAQATAARSASVSSAIESHEQALSDALSSFNLTAGAAAEQLEQTIALALHQEQQAASQAYRDHLVATAEMTLDADVDPVGNAVLAGRTLSNAGSTAATWVPIPTGGPRWLFWSRSEPATADRPSTPPARTHPFPTAGDYAAFLKGMGAGIKDGFMGSVDLVRMAGSAIGTTAKWSFFTFSGPGLHS